MPKKKKAAVEKQLPYRRDNTVEVVRRTYDLPRDIAMRLDVEAARRQTSKGQLLRLILDKALPPA